MKKYNKNYLIFLSIFIIALFFFSNLYAVEDKKFLSLKNKKVNLRQGPSFEYPIKLIYKKKYLPVEILDTSETWRKIKDLENNTGWIHISQLSKKKAAIVVDDDLVMFKSPTIYSKPIVVLKKGKLTRVIKCKNDWCKVKVGKYKGWLKKKSLWGLI